MVVFIIRRLLQAAGVVAAVSLVVFVGLYGIGDPALLLVDPDAPAAERQRAIEMLGLDRPLWMQYLSFVGNALQGDLGRSYVYNEPSISLILSRLPATLELAFVAMLIAIFIGVPLGLWAGLKGDGPSDRLIVTGSILGFSLPSFWQGMMLVWIFAVLLGWFPSNGRGELGTIPLLGIKTSLATWDGIRHLILPAINLALFKTALLIRLTRAGVREALVLDFVKFARAKGLSERRVIGVHVLKYIMVPIVTVTGLEFGQLIAFATVTETVFAWPGSGKLIIDSIYKLDRPVVVAYLMVVVVMFVAINTLVDILYSALDPRVRLTERR
jgi:peptide/nickel transport system permease protein